MVFQFDNRESEVIKSGFFQKGCFCLVFIVVFFLKGNSQELTLKETIDYIEYIINLDLSSQQNLYNGKKFVNLTLEENVVNVKYVWQNNNDVIFEEYLGANIDYNEIEFRIDDISEISKGTRKEKFTLKLKCKNNTKDCFHMVNEAIKPNYSLEFSDRPNAINHFDYINLFYLKNVKNRDLLYNGISFLFDKFQSSNVESGYATGQIISKTSNEYVHQEKIPLLKNNGIYTLEADIGGFKYTVILDSGASDVSIPKSLESKLRDKMIIDSGNYLKPGLYTIANGEVVLSDRLILPYVSIGNVKINNVKCSVNDSFDIILLGKSFLDYLKSWKIDNSNNLLIIEF